MYPKSSYVAEVHYYVRESGTDTLTLKLDGTIIKEGIAISGSKGEKKSVSVELIAPESNNYKLKAIATSSPYETRTTTLRVLQPLPNLPVLMIFKAPDLADLDVSPYIEYLDTKNIASSTIQLTPETNNPDWILQKLKTQYESEEGLTASVFIGRNANVYVKRYESLDDYWKKGGSDNWIRRVPVFRIASSRAGTERDEIITFMQKLRTPIKARVRNTDDMIVVNGWNRDFRPREISAGVTDNFKCNFLKHPNAEELSKVRFSNHDNFKTTWTNHIPDEDYTYWKCYFDRPSLVKFVVEPGPLQVSVFENGKSKGTFTQGEHEYLITHGTLEIKQYTGQNTIFNILEISEFAVTPIIFWGDHGKQAWVYAYDLDGVWGHTAITASEYKYLSALAFVEGCTVWGLKEGASFSSIPLFDSDSTPQVVILGYLTNGGILGKGPAEKELDIWKSIKEGKIIAEVFKDQLASGFDGASTDDLNPASVPDAYIKFRGNPAFSLQDFAIEDTPYDIEYEIPIPPMATITKEGFFTWLKETKKAIDIDALPSVSEWDPKWENKWIHWIEEDIDFTLIWGKRGEEHKVCSIKINPHQNPIESADQIIGFYPIEMNIHTAKEIFGELPLIEVGEMEKEINLRLYLKKEEEGKWRVFGDAIVTDCDDVPLSDVRLILDDTVKTAIEGITYEFLGVEEGVHTIRALKENYGICEDKPSTVEFTLP